jgi:hypothetical protein
MSPILLAGPAPQEIASFWFSRSRIRMVVRGSGPDVFGSDGVVSGPFAQNVNILTDKHNLTIEFIIILVLIFSNLNLKKYILKTPLLNLILSSV